MLFRDTQRARERACGVQSSDDTFSYFTPSAPGSYKETEIVQRREKMY